MTYQMWDSKISDEIELTLFSKNQIDEITSLWNKNLKLVKDPKKISTQNPLFPYLQKNENAMPIRSVLASVRYHYNAFGIIEKPYLDLEFWDSHIGFYSYSFSQYKVECIRIHFFSEDESHSENLITCLTNGCCKKDIEINTGLVWRGYCVLRPIHSCVVGRTAIEFDTRPIKSVPKRAVLEKEAGGMPFLKAKQLCTANLMNANFSTVTTEFIQQDPNLGHCATASLWVSTNLMSHKYGTYNFNYRTITNTALGQTRHLLSDNNHSFQLVDEGLKSSEIKSAIQASGASILSFSKEDETVKQAFQRLSLEIYSFVESGFPVLLNITDNKNNIGHVVAVVGHLLPKIDNIKGFLSITPIGAKNKSKAKDKHYLIGNITNIYYVHDDAYGPFNRIIFLNKKSEIKNIEKKKNDNSNDFLIIESGRDRKEYNLDQIIVPVAPNIKASAASVCRDVIEVFDTIYGDIFKTPIKFLWRSILITGSDFKHSICKRGYSPVIRKWYANLHLPKYIWLFEVSIFKKSEISKYFNNDSSQPRWIDGEFIYDATIPSNNPRLISARMIKSFTDYKRIQDCSEKNKHKGICAKCFVNFSDHTMSRFGCYESSCNDVTKGECYECQISKK